jgi:hypothetical protein
MAVQTPAPSLSESAKIGHFECCEQQKKEKIPKHLTLFSNLQKKVSGAM